MKIYNKGRGVHEREIAGIEKLQAELPSDWMAFTNLELALSSGGREIDVILVIEDRIVLVDLKDWRGKIESSGGSWSNGGKLIEGPSPVEKVLNNARELKIQLEKYLKSINKNGGKVDVPKVEGCVVLTGTLDRSGISPTEINRVFSIDLFIKMLKNVKERINQLGGAAPAFHSPGLMTPSWKTTLSKFFNVDTGNFKFSTRKYGNYQANSTLPCFQHNKGIFSEFDVTDPTANDASGLLRRWDFTKAESRFQNENARNEIAGRERKIISWLNDRNPECESSILQPRVDDTEKGVNYWEVFDRRRRLDRLQDLSKNKVLEISLEMRIELIRQVLVQVKILHDLDVPHLDLGLHSVWIEPPSIARISHFLAARLPEVQTLGINRYQFLSTLSVPDDQFNPNGSGLQKDVFLLACIAHFLIFGVSPQGSSIADLVEWNPEIDQEGSFLDLHSWLSRGLDWDCQNRFKNAGMMLDALNETLQSKPNVKEIIEGLERFKTVSSQIKVFNKYRPTEELRDDNIVSIWLSQRNNETVLIKLWKSEGWGDQLKEGPKILAFLQQSEELILDTPPGCVPIKEIIWTGDAIVLVQEYVVAPTLSLSLSENWIFWSNPENSFIFLKKLSQIIEVLHERNLAHGDLKPDNILVLNTTYEPLLIDILDFSPTDDGEKATNAYSPIMGGKFERDCFAVTKIAEEIFQKLTLDGDLQRLLVEAISKVRNSMPNNGTLLPFVEALDIALKPEPTDEGRIIEVSMIGIDTRPFLADEGSIGLRAAKQSKQLRLRGAAEELVVELDSYGQPISARRVNIDQKGISYSIKNEFATINATIKFIKSANNDLSAIEKLLKDEHIAELWASTNNNNQAISSLDIVSESDEELIEDDLLDSDENEDTLNEVVASQLVAEKTDVPSLWHKLIEVEAELLLVGTAVGSSIYSKTYQRHLVPFQLDTGSFDFARDDTVTVLREEKNGRWNKIAKLELSTLKSDLLQLESLRLGKNSNNFISEGQRLRFDSHYEVTSRLRRREASERILNRQARLADLIDVFDSTSEKEPFNVNSEVTVDEIKSRYSLNPIQAQAFVNLLKIRPLSLLQGPPGTGKTHFIGALVHYVLTHGLAHNVLIASQTHEAVNGAAEAILKLFKDGDETPSILRVGHESNVSDLLLPYHVGKVENLFKDRFRAEQKLRLEIVGKALSLPEMLIQDLIFTEVIIRPVVDTLLRLNDEVDDLDVNNRIAGLKTTLSTLFSNLPIDVIEQDEINGGLTDSIAQALSKFHKYENFAKIKSFSNVAMLARDFMGSVSSWHRSFEAFLAGTREIVVGTCVGLGRSSLGLTSTPFDLVIVDEAARCNSGELAVPLQSGRWIVLVGDHFQLEPQLKSNLVKNVARDLKISEREILRSDFERVFESSYGYKAGFTLKQQYRMLPPIGEIVSEAFYDRSLLHGRSEPIIPNEFLPESLDSAITWIKTDNFGAQAFQKELKKGRNKKGALINPIESELIIDLIKSWDKSEKFHDWLDTQNKFTECIGIICTYRAQSEMIQQKLRNAFLTESMRATIKIDTVDSYQGKENPIVILSLVRNNEDGIYENSLKTIKPGFMARPNRLNVAISRAMDRLVIVGAFNGWTIDSPMDFIKKGFIKQEALKEAKLIDGVIFKGLLETIPISESKKGRERIVPHEAEQS